MSENCNHKSNWKTHVKVLSALMIGILIGVPIGSFVKIPLPNIAKVGRNAGGENKDYDIQELEVNYLQMLEGVKGEAFEIVNGVKCVYSCKEAYPDGDRIVYKFNGYIGEEISKKAQKFQFSYIVKPFVANGELTFSGDEIARVFLEPEDLVVGIDGMKRIINAFIVPQLKPFASYAPTGAFAIKELYSNMAVLKVAKEK